MNRPLLSVQGLTKRFGALAATDALDLTVMPGEIHALIGPNGAGKTTVIAQLAGELAPDAGTIRLAGRDITRLPVYRRVALGLVRSFQVTSLFPEYTAEENLALAVQARSGHSFRFWRAARHDPALTEPARQVLAQLGLAQQARVPAAELGHGEQRQLEVALALACRPRLLLLDEPLAGIGPGGSRHMTDLLAGLKGQVTLLLVEHDMDAVFRLADRITVLAYGRAIASGPPEAIRRHPEVRRAYLGEAD